MSALQKLFQSSEYRRRILMAFTGVAICGFSVGLFSYSSFGMDPFQVFAHGTCIPTHLRFGTWYVILSAVMLGIVLVLDRHKIGFGTVVNILLVGHLADLSEFILQKVLPSPSLTARIILLLAGIVIMCLASALYFTADLGVSVYDAIALILHEKKNWPFNIVRICTDLICVITGVLFGASAGIGTVITAFFMGPLISFFSRTVAVPLRFGKHAQINQ